MREADDDNGFFWRVVIAVALLHVSFLVALQRIEPRPADALARGVRGARADANRSVNPEPRRPLVYVTEARRDGVFIRSTEALSDHELDRIGELYRTTDRLYVAWHGLVPRAVPPLELRLVSVRTLNDPTLFDLDTRRGTYYGRYHGGPRIAYVTALALRHEEHLAHEFAHHLSATYGRPRVGEEARTRAFEEAFLRLRAALANPHVGAASAMFSAPRRVVRYDAQLAAHTSRPLGADDLVWTRSLLLEAEGLFAEFTGTAPRSVPPWSLTVFARAELSERLDRVCAAAPDDDREPLGRYLPDRDLVVLPRSRLGHQRSVLHLAAHRLAALHDLRLSVFDEEILALAFEQAVFRRREGESSHSYLGL